MKGPLAPLEDTRERSARHRECKRRRNERGQSSCSIVRERMGHVGQCKKRGSSGSAWAQCARTLHIGCPQTEVRNLDFLTST